MSFGFDAAVPSQPAVRILGKMGQNLLDYALLGGIRPLIDLVFYLSLQVGIQMWIYDFMGKNIYKILLLNSTLRLYLNDSPKLDWKAKWFIT